MPPRRVLVPGRIRKPGRGEEVRAAGRPVNPVGAGGGQRRGRAGCALHAALSAAALGLSALPASVSVAAEPRAVSLGIEAGGRTFDAMSVGDVRPQPRGEVAGAVEVGYVASQNWVVSLSGRLDGSWFDFTDGAGA